MVNFNNMYFYINSNIRSDASAPTESASAPPMEEIKEHFFIPQDAEAASKKYCYMPTSAMKGSDYKFHANTVGLILSLQGLVDTIQKPLIKEKKEGDKGIMNRILDIFEASARTPNIDNSTNVNIGNTFQTTNITHLHSKPTKEKKDVKVKDKQAENKALLQLAGLVGLGILLYFGYKSGEAAAKLEGQTEKRDSLKHQINKWQTDNPSYNQDDEYTVNLNAASKIGSKVLDRHVSNHQKDLISKVMLAASGFFLFTGGFILASAPLVLASTVALGVTITYILFSKGFDRTEQHDERDADLIQEKLKVIEAYRTKNESNVHSFNPSSFDEKGNYKSQ